MPNSYEHSYQHDLDNVIDASDAVLAIGTEKVDTTTLKDRSLNNNDATIHGAMPSNGYFLSRRFDGDDDYLDCGNNSSLNVSNTLYLSMLIFQKTVSPESTSYNQGIIDKLNYGTNTGFLFAFRSTDNYVKTFIGNTDNLFSTANELNVWNHYDFSIDGVGYFELHKNGILVDSGNHGTYTNNTTDLIIGKNTAFLNFIMGFIIVSNSKPYNYNTIARLPLYSHNFERYPNSDTSLTSVFPYTSGIITSGSFNKTDGLKCTSAGQVVFSNSFEFDGSEYITLVINGVEYSGTTTVTQGTITATIAQGSNDITIDMGTNDVLKDVRIQFRSEV